MPVTVCEWRVIQIFPGETQACTEAGAGILLFALISRTGVYISRFSLVEAIISF